MTTPTPEATLVERLERAVGPDRALADEVLLACGWTRGRELERGTLMECWVAPDGKMIEGPQPDPLASLDAALMLVPEGYNKSFAETVYGHHRADIWKSDDRTTERHAEASSMAISLCIAALKARNL